MPKGVPKSKHTKIKALTKVCLKCNKAVELSEFYVNSENRNGLFKDNVCKGCYYKTIKSKDDLIDMCKLNNREYREDLWIWSQNKANELLNSNQEYLEMKNIQEKERMYFNECLKQYVRQFNQTQYYHFIPFTAQEELIKQVEQDIKASKGEVSDITNENEERFYVAKWHGNFTQSEVDYLDQYLDGLQRDFDISNTSHLDYAKKVCKASLAMDKSFDDVINGVSGAEARYKNARETFNALSESAKFSEKTRSINDNTGLGSLGETIKRLESSGFLQKKIVFEKDDLDKITEDLRWILASVGEEV